MTAVSAIVFFLGLLFGFQRPSRLLPLRLCATVLLRCTPFNPGAAFFISKRLLCQAAVAAAFHRFASSGFNTAPWRFVSSCRGGAEPTSLPRPLSTRFVDSLFRLVPVCRPCDFAVSRGGGFYHRRVGSQLRSPTSYFVFHFFRPGLPSPVRLRLSVRGARLLPPPRWESTPYFRLRIPSFDLSG